MLNLTFDNRFVTELPADPRDDNQRRQVHKACYSLVKPTPVAAPTLLSHASEVADLLGLSEADCNRDDFLQMVAGNRLLSGMQPYAMCYGGHQFGNWAGQLGDGRAINLGEVLGKQGQRWTLQLKGAGATPYSRTADGLAVLRSSIREYLCSEAMHHLGVPTTRALSLVTTGEQVMRDMLYDGNAAYEPGAIVCRVSPSFVRFGNFQLLAARNEHAELRQLTDFVIHHHFNHLESQYAVGSGQIVAAFFDEVCQLTAHMIVEWMRVGFVHGVMNTDNMSILGLTIDYGPYGWLEDYDPEWTPNTTDAQHRRYRFGQQANVALWNCYQLANALFPLVNDTAPLEASLESFQQSYQTQWLAMMAAKLGLLEFKSGDEILFDELEQVLTMVETDMTLFYRCLAQEQLNVESFRPAFYTNELSDEYRETLTTWLAKYQVRLAQDERSHTDRATAMNAVNPKFVFRNYLAQQAIDLAEAGDPSRINELLDVLRKPYDQQAERSAFAAQRPDWAKTKVGCSMLSCSS
ncbi:protein adenylyltransferase SelO [Arenicella xantha]|uniref:Protein nucleotidyltransferase YdiU n=1 Tax=Arenicella xantha TaxID=644221 RepID=A0A395JH28_9GAMM|nr:YdiU family protein [Arenicella xantha]RBP47088.1 uncharacterized protein YdiU (UPF0061 family) [Arenicella xantha]